MSQLCSSMRTRHSQKALRTAGSIPARCRFTSYGKSIDLYANGFEVSSKVPGAMPINISGTSLAAPHVTNLAAKMLAVNPRLSVADVRRIMEETATAEGPRGLKVINPVAAVAKARS